MRVSFLKVFSWPHSPSPTPSFSLWAASSCQASWERAATCEQPFPTVSSEISRASHGSWYLSLTLRHTPLSETARSKCHPFPFINSLSELAQETCFSAAERQGKHRRILHGRSISTQRDSTTLQPQSWGAAPEACAEHGDEGVASWAAALCSEQLFLFPG